MTESERILRPTLATDPVTAEAVEALVRRHSGNWTSADEADLNAWLVKEARHRAAYERMSRVWDLAGQLRRTMVRRPAVRPRRFHWTLAAGCILGFLVAITVPFARLGYRWWSGTPVRWITPLGEARTLVLEDGTHVRLDAGSELVAQIGAGGRHVSLKRGEALFTVTHETHRPFEIESGPGTISDLGTRFDVEILSGATHVSVLEGRVELATSRGRLLLSKGKRSGYDSSGSFLPARAVDISLGDAPGVRRVFDAEPLSDVLERLARYHAVTFVYSEPSLSHLRLSGTFRLDDLPLVLRSLSATLPVDTRSLDSNHIEVTTRDTLGPGHAR